MSPLLKDALEAENRIDVRWFVVDTPKKSFLGTVETLILSRLDYRWNTLCNGSVRHG